MTHLLGSVITQMNNYYTGAHYLFVMATRQQSPTTYRGDRSVGCLTEELLCEAAHNSIRVVCKLRYVDQRLVRLV